MEFGFSFNAAAGVVLASVSSDANYKVTLRWTRESRVRRTKQETGNTMESEEYHLSGMDFVDLRWKLMSA